MHHGTAGCKHGASGSLGWVDVRDSVPRLEIPRGAWCGGEWPDGVGRHGSRVAMHGAAGTVPEREAQALSDDVSYVCVRAELTIRRQELTGTS